jgi:hypothetical protein
MSFRRVDRAEICQVAVRASCSQTEPAQTVIPDVECFYDSSLQEAQLMKSSTRLNRSEPGIGRFSRQLRLVFRPSLTRVNQRGKEESPTIYQPIQSRSSLGRFLKDY